ncbi:serine O-acetyltransferase [Clostridium saccharobutylicum]|uniref:Serine acetyltransferase n=1 Tax=Clostridium saccharobutylicum DSM 13864 TaxID=1345695 RepID=U5MTP2_CLOSA|nr:serine acetyltransferase [Clostridium saccharobutylicum]AGX43940.1 serine acetyltransferase [Clostridium saccharobutylicum DSM 13864]AQR91238.1 serine acetyltransferase [Clostridium saccharobutylicum]AQS01142.1 serine acetyltransferase [Clostridium saccharobutylicum]AQS15125.1 serine acetyltransferase [Clostridium saccharobutylicum]MBA2905251.1 serine O-acetyltransferase [Clostridium saccharobutylicum]
MNKNNIKEIYAYINIIRSIPLLIAYKFSKNRTIINKDIVENMKRRDGDIHHNWGNIQSLNYLLVCYPEFRNVFYYRIGLLSQILKLFYPKMKPLYITSNGIGSGLVMYHGFSTIIYAKSIGENCTVYHNVTIGKTDDVPTIGNNVTICTGAKVIGGINIGNNSTIGAGAIVTKDVPNNCVVVGNNEIMKRNGTRVNKKIQLVK